MILLPSISFFYVRFFEYDKPKVCFYSLQFLNKNHTVKLIVVKAFQWVLKIVCAIKDTGKWADFE